MANFNDLAGVDTDEQKMASSDVVAQGRAKRAARYVAKGAGVSQGDQAASTRKQLRDAATKAEGDYTQGGKAKAAALRQSASQIQGADEDD